MLLQTKTRAVAVAQECSLLEGPVCPLVRQAQLGQAVHQGGQRRALVIQALVAQVVGMVRQQLHPQEMVVLRPTVAVAVAVEIAVPLRAVAVGVLFTVAVAVAVVRYRAVREPQERQYTVAQVAQVETMLLVVLGMHQAVAVAVAAQLMREGTEHVVRFEFGRF